MRWSGRPTSGPGEVRGPASALWQRGRVNGPSASPSRTVPPKALVSLGTRAFVLPGTVQHALNRWGDCRTGGPNHGVPARQPRTANAGERLRFLAGAVPGGAVPAPHGQRPGQGERQARRVHSSSGRPGTRRPSVSHRRASSLKIGSRPEQRTLSSLPRWTPMTGVGRIVADVMVITGSTPPGTAGSPATTDGLAEANAHHVIRGGLAPFGDTTSTTRGFPPAQGRRTSGGTAPGSSARAAGLCASAAGRGSRSPPGRRHRPAGQRGGPAPVRSRAAGLYAVASSRHSTDALVRQLEARLVRSPRRTHPPVRSRP